MKPRHCRDISRREFVGLMAMALGIGLTACGSGKAKEKLAPYWVAEKVEADGVAVEMDDVESFMMITFLEDGTGRASSMGEDGGWFEWIDNGDVVAMKQSGGVINAKHSGDKLVLEIREGDSVLTVTLKSVETMPDSFV